MEPDEQTALKLDAEFKRNLQLIRPYLLKLENCESMNNCGVWIDKLTSSQMYEKLLRNKYLLLLCYQLSKGSIDEPFLAPPPEGDLQPMALADGWSDSGDSVSIPSVQITDLTPNQQCILWNDQTQSEASQNIAEHQAAGDARPVQATDLTLLGYRDVSERTSPVLRSPPLVITPVTTAILSDSDSAQKCLDDNINANHYVLTEDRQRRLTNSYNQDFFQNKHLEQIHNTSLTQSCEDRSAKMAKKLSELRQQNAVLSAELAVLKEETDRKDIRNAATVISFQEEIVILRTRMQELMSLKANIQESHETLAEGWSGALEKLTKRLRDAQSARDFLLQAVTRMEEELKELAANKAKELEELKSFHKMELGRLIASMGEEILDVKKDYTAKLEQMNEYYTNKINNINDYHTKKVEEMASMHAEGIQEKDDAMKEKDTEISRLELVIQEQCTKLQSEVVTMRGRMLEKCTNERCLATRMKMAHMERQIAKMDRTKAKWLRSYDTKLLALQKEKNILECTLQLHLMKQRAQLLSEAADSNQAEITQAVDKLEAKYKEVVASIQVAAIKRRLQDQKSLESLLSLACGVQSPASPENTGADATIFQVSSHFGGNSAFGGESSGSRSGSPCDECPKSRSQSPPSREARLKQHLGQAAVQFFAQQRNLQILSDKN